MTTTPLTRHWSQNHIGIPYAECNCAQLVARVLRTEFGRSDLASELEGFPEHLANTQARSEAIYLHRFDLGQDIEQPVDGAGVVLQVGNKLQHIGMIALIGNGTEPWVLHTTPKSGSVLERLGRVMRLYKVQGYYTWRAMQPAQVA